jgi:hypothetical protein
MVGYRPIAWRHPEPNRTMNDFVPPLLMRTPKCLSVPSHRVVVPLAGGCAVATLGLVASRTYGTESSGDKRIRLGISERYIATDGYLGMAPDRQAPTRRA